MPLLPAFLALTLVGGPGAQRPKIPSGEWRPYSIGSGIQVDFSLPPFRDNMRDPSIGLDVVLWFSLHQDRHELKALHQIIPETNNDPADEWLSQSQEGTLDGHTLISQKDILFQGWPGLAYQTRSRIGTPTAFRAIVVGKRLIILAAKGPEKGLDGSANRFFGSLRLPPSIGRGSLTRVGPEWQRHSVGSIGISALFPKPPEDNPNSEGTTGSATATYGNRRFNIFYHQHDDFLTPVDQVPPEQALAVLQEMNDVAVHAFKGVNAKSEAFETPSGKGWRTILWDPEGKRFHRFDAFFRGGRSIRLAAAVPACLAKSPELDRFFTSVKAD